jgi:arginine exporter protein ArgO
VPGNQAIQAEEPIARAVQTGFAGIGNWWSNTDVSIPVKIIGLIVASLVVVKNSQWLLPLALGLGLIYLLYYTVRNWLQATANEAEQRPKQPSKREIKAKEVAQVRGWIRQRPFSDRATELLGSLLVGAFACMVFNLLGLAIGGSLLNMTIESWALYAWLCTTSIAACWALLFVGKVWERRDGEQVMRRLSLSAIGLFVGALAFFAAGTFGINLSDAARFNFSSETTSQFVIQGVPMLPAYLIFFAGLFGILRWWRKSDPTRPTRLSMVSVSLCLIWATVFSHLLEVPMTPNCILAVVISVSLQLAAPWLAPQQRLEICAEQDRSD